MLLAAFSNTAHTERVKTRGSLGNKSQHNHPEQKSCSFFHHYKEFVLADDIPAYFFLKLLSHVLALMAVFIFHSNGAEYCSFTSVFINNSSTTFRINLLTRRIQMRKAKTPICFRTHFHLYCPTVSAQFTQ